MERTPRLRMLRPAAAAASVFLLPPSPPPTFSVRPSVLAPRLQFVRRPCVPACVRPLLVVVRRHSSVASAPSRWIGRLSPPLFLPLPRLRLRRLQRSASYVRSSESESDPQTATATNSTVIQCFWRENSLVGKLSTFLNSSLIHLSPAFTEDGRHNTTIKVRLLAIVITRRACNEAHLSRNYSQIRLMDNRILIQVR